MDLTTIFMNLRNKNEPVPKPMRLPQSEEIEKIEQVLNVKFHDDYREYLLNVSDVVYGTIEPAQITIPDSHDYLLAVVNDAKAYGLPKDYLPICEDNGSFYCMDSNGQIHFYGVDYGGFTGEIWENIGTWIMQIWLGERSTL